jgi:hypothetical protein
MNRDGHNEYVKFFTGVEVEHTPAFGMQTLFVIGVQPSSEITPRLSNPGQHIYFGANQSFPNPNINDAETWKSWENMITHYLQMGYLCTLDLDVSAVEGLVEGPLCEYNNFIPMISVKVPYAQMLGYNATIKIDDKDFAATNPGVWCHSLHDLRDRSKFTDWSKYTKDTILK